MVDLTSSVLDGSGVMEPKTGASHSPLTNPRQVVKSLLFITVSWKLWAVRRARFSSRVVPNTDLVQAYYLPMSPCIHYSLFCG